MTGLADKLNPAGQQLYRSSLRRAVLKMLDNPALPSEEATRARTWLANPNRGTLAMEKLKDRIVERLRELRGDEQLKAA